MNKAESLAKVSKDLMLIEPYYGLFLIGLNKQWVSIETASVGEHNLNFYLKINPDFWETLTQKKRMGLLKHELLHIAFFHLTDYKHLEDQRIANMAMDIEINQYINREWLPEGGLLPETFPELKLEPKKGTFYYYEKLMEEKEKQEQNIQTCIQAMENGETEVELPNGSRVTLPNHKDWEELQQNMDEATEKLIKAQTQHLMEQVVDQVDKLQGTTPSEIEEILKRLQTLDPPKFDWRGYMRRFVGKSTKVYTKKSRRKYNKRTPDFPGLKIKLQKHILVAIDTSGSVSKTELLEFLGEINHIYRTGAEVSIIQCDTAISYIGKFNPKKDFTVKGRSGTSFQPVIDYYNENSSKYSCLFYLTDGYAPAPDNARGNLLWVIPSDGKINKSLPGAQIQLN